MLLFWLQFLKILKIVIKIPLGSHDPIKMNLHKLRSNYPL